MHPEEAKELILKKVSKMKRLDIEKKIFEVLQENHEIGREFIEEHLDAYEINDPSLLATKINDIASKETTMGFLFQDLLKITSDKIGMGEVLLSLCIKNAISGGTDDVDVIISDEENYEVKKVSKSGIFTFSERFTEYNDLGLLMNMAIMNFSNHSIFKGKNLYTVSAKEVRTFKMVLEKFLLTNTGGKIPFHKKQFVTKVDGKIMEIVDNRIFSVNTSKKEFWAYYSMFNFKEHVLNSKIKKDTMNLFTGIYKNEEHIKETINSLFSTTPLRQILKNTRGVFLILPDFTISYFTPHKELSTLYNPSEFFLYDISRNKMNFKGPFLKGNPRAEKTPGELPEEFNLL